MKPILFNTEMVRAILDGRKTTTRRVIKPQPLDGRMTAAGFLTKIPERMNWGGKIVKPPYQIGDVLYVRETFTELCRTDENGYTHYNESFYLYAADSPQIDLYDDNGFLLDDQRIKWHPSLHMPKEAARIFLCVTDVRAERLQGITEGGAKAEGIKSYWSEPHRDDAPFIGCAKEVGEDLCSTRHEAFSQLWNSTIKKSDLDKYGWDANPWVWVYEFERCEKPKEGLI